MKALIVGGGMIAHDQLLPSLLHLTKTGVLDSVAVVASRYRTVESLRSAFPGRTFQTFPADDGSAQPESL